MAEHDLDLALLAVRHPHTGQPIVAQVIARDGRRSSKTVLHPRFQVAIDKAASRAGKRAYNDYIEEWRKVARACSDEVEAEVTAEVERLETDVAQLETPPQRSRIPKAEMQVADGVKIAGETETADVGGFPSERFVLRLKIAF